MKKKIGIIGGAGPIASCLMYQEIIRRCQQDFACKYDNDFPEIVVLNYPFSPMLTMKDLRKNRAKLVSELQECFDRLAQQGVQVSIIACNTLHTLLDEVKVQSTECLRIDQTVLDCIRDKDLKRVAVFGTETTMNLNLYKCSLTMSENQHLISGIIDRILAGTLSQEELDEFVNAIRELYERTPFDCMVLGCTELSIIFDQIKHLEEELGIKILDSTRLLASAVLEKSFYQDYRCLSPPRNLCSHYCTSDI